MTGKRMFMTFREAEARGAYDEFPMFPPEVDPQLHLSCNDRAQPFWLVCAKDTVLVLMTGTSTVEVRHRGTQCFDTAAGDFIYVPAGAPHRILPAESSIQYRYKAAKPGLEAAAWYCGSCDAEVSRETWDAERELPQSAYLRACLAFNADSDRRRCGSCGTIHPEVDLSGISWAEVAVELGSKGEAA